MLDDLAALGLRFCRSPFLWYVVFALLVAWLLSGCRPPAHDLPLLR